MRIAAGNAGALRFGLTAGLALADARARVPQLAAVEMDDAADHALLERMADFCDRYTPMVALDGADGLTLDITGCAHLFGGEACLLQDLMERLAKAGMEARFSIADSPAGASAFARFSRVGIVEAGSQARHAADLPVNALWLSHDKLTALSRAGLKTVGDLIDRPAPALAARFGSELISSLDALVGRRDSRITPRRAMPAAIAERRFPEPIASEDVALDALTSLGAQLSRSLESRGQGARRFEASFHRTDGRVIWLDIATARAVRDPQLIARLFRERLDALSDPLDPGFGFDLIRLGAHGCERFIQAQTGFDTKTAEEEEVAELLDRLSTRFGAAAVMRFQPADTHIPERAERMVSVLSLQEAPGTWPKADTGEPPTRPITLYTPPQAIETTHEVPDGPPRLFRWRRVVHRIVHAEGPERICEEWWHFKEPMPARDYYRIEDEDGRRFWVFREGLHGEGAVPPRWFLHGRFA